MTAIKKTKTKTQAPAPAAKVKTVARKATKPTKTAPAASVRKPAAAGPKAAVPVITAKPVETGVTARIDIGFGNTLFIRGEGPGLSWDKGTVMSCGGTDLWQWVAGEAARPVTFKLLVNDLTWSTGPDFTVQPGTTTTLTPEF